MHDGIQKVVRSRQFCEIHLIEVLMPAGVRMPKQSFPSCSLQLVISGGYREPSSNAIREPLSVHFHPQGDPQDAIVDEASRVFGICLPGERVEVLRRYGGSPSEPSDLTSPGVVECMLRLHREFRTGDGSSHFAVEALACELLAHFSRQAQTAEPGVPAWLRRAFALVSDEPWRDLSLGLVADECGVHPSHLAREFRRKYGRSLGDQLRGRRCRLAVSLLQSTDWPLREVASRAGFHDASHLTKTLKLQTGLTPGALRCRMSDIQPTFAPLVQ